MKKNLLVSILAISLAMNIGVAGVLGYKLLETKNVSRERVCPFGSDDNPLYKALNLNGEQLKLVRSIADSFHRQVGVIAGDIQEKRNIMVSLLEGEIVNEEDVGLIQQEIRLLQANIQDRVFQHLLEMKNILTPEQRQVFFQTMRQSFGKNNLQCNH